MAVAISTEFPAYEPPLRGLVQQHLDMKDEPLLLAVYYKPQRDPHDIFLFEVIDGFGANGVDADKEFFEVTYHSTAGFPMEPGQSLHMLMTNPNEVAVAARENWPLLAELRNAIHDGNYKILHHQDKSHPKIWGQVGG